MKLCSCSFIGLLAVSFHEHHFFFVRAAIWAKSIEYLGNVLVFSVDFKISFPGFYSLVRSAHAYIKPRDFELKCRLSCIRRSRGCFSISKRYKNVWWWWQRKTRPYSVLPSFSLCEAQIFSWWIIIVTNFQMFLTSSSSALRQMSHILQWRCGTIIKNTMFDVSFHIFFPVECVTPAYWRAMRKYAPTIWRLWWRNSSGK